MKEEGILIFNKTTFELFPHGATISAGRGERAKSGSRVSPVSSDGDWPGQWSPVWAVSSVHCVHCVHCVTHTNSLHLNQDNQLITRQECDTRAGGGLRNRLGIESMIIISWRSHTQHGTRPSQPRQLLFYAKIMHPGLARLRKTNVNRVNSNHLAINLGDKFFRI